MTARWFDLPLNDWVTLNAKLRGLVQSVNADIAAVSGGGVSDGDKGDITVTASGATWTIDAGAVTLAKQADLAQNTVIGRITASTGVPESLTAANVRTIINVADGATANASDASLRDRATHTGTQTASTISDFAATVTANSAVTANTAKVTNATHTGDVTGDGALTIANDVVTYAKMQNVSAASRLLGRGDAGAGDPQEITLGAGLTMTGATLAASGGGGGSSDVIGAAAPMSAVAVNNAAYQVLMTDAITVVAGDQIEVEVIGTYLNNSGGTITPRVQIALGAFTCEAISGTTIAANATNRSTYRITGRFAIASAASAGATLWHERNVPAAANTANNIAATTIRPSFNTSASDLTGAQTLEVRMRSSTATATQTFTVFSWRVRKTAAV